MDMLNTIACKVTSLFQARGIVNEEDSEIYEFGMLQLLRNIINWLSIAIIAVVFQEIIPCFIFALAFMLLRSRAGGYHAGTPFRCYILTQSIMIIALSIYKYVSVDNLVIIGTFVVASFMLLLLAPVDSPNKPLDGIEKIHYKTKTFEIWGIEAAVSVALILAKCFRWFECIVLAMVVLAISLSAGIIAKKA